MEPVLWTDDAHALTFDRPHKLDAVDRIVQEDLSARVHGRGRCRPCVHVRKGEEDAFSAGREVIWMKANMVVGADEEITRLVGRIV